MKICVISTTVFPIVPPWGTIGYAGLEVVAYYCAMGLAKLGHEVWLVAPDGSSCPGVNVVHTGPPGAHDEHAAFQRYWKELEKFDCIVDHSWQRWTMVLKREGTLTRPVLNVLHAPVDTMFQTPPPIDRPCVVCISYDQKNHYENLFAHATARVCHNGIDLTFYKDLKVPRSDRFLFLARFSTIKGPDLAIEACKRAGVGLDLVGDTSITNEPELLERCTKMADGEQIRFIGPCSRGEAVYWFSRSKGLIHLNQRFREPFGLAPVEAMACGCPVVAWDYGAMRETIDHGGSGWLVRSMDEAIEAIRSSYEEGHGKERWENMRERCVERARMFTVERMASDYDLLCHEAVETGGW